MKKNDFINLSVIKKSFAAMMAILFVAVALTVPVFAQQESGQINGTVKDPNEAVKRLSKD
ncbi:MAG TPA: hypothetical protein VGP58_15300 [Pyrinomonadaceae bacterium]|jgi:hypothetical protein|nr:hypothetical protein [Pyrinomonadaceae bacterium]